MGTDGIVIYEDALQKTTSIDFIKNVTGDVSAEVDLNGNTIDRITNGTIVLSEDDYRAETDGMLLLKSSYLNTLEPGEYTLALHYNPQGEAYVENEDNEAPATTSIIVMVKNPKLLTITEPEAIKGIANGTEKSAEALKLPSKVTIKTENESITTADVIWDLENLVSGSYDRDVLAEQTFTVGGRVVLPDGTDANGLSLKVQVTVTVEKAVPTVTTEPEVSKLPAVSTKPITSAEPVQNPNTEYKTSLGDVNDDGQVTLSDAQLILKVALKITELKEEQKQNADVNGDGEITLQDAQITLKYALKIIETF